MDDQATTKTLLLAEEQPEAEYELPPQRSASGPSRVFWMVAPLVVLAFIESFSFGILSPMLSIVQTEVMPASMQWLCMGMCLTDWLLCLDIVAVLCAPVQ